MSLNLNLTNKGDYPLLNQDDMAFNKVITVELLLHDIGVLQFFSSNKNSRPEN